VAAGSPRYIADSSVLARLGQPVVHAVLAPMHASGELASCRVLELERLYSARNLADFRAMRFELLGYPQIETEQADFDRAVDVMELLARRGQHRAARMPELLLAAIAERAGLTLLHYDAHFDLIGEVTGQTMEWVVPRGSVP
jgi:predicted nucleic acid-binding protein